MANAIIVKTRVQAENIDALNRNAKASADMPNGKAVTLAWSATEGDEVFTATAATTGLEFKIGRKEDLIVATGSILESEKYDAWLLEVTSNSGVWLAVNPEVNKLIIGKVYAGLDARLFTNVAGEPFSVIYLEKGDIIQVSKDFFYAGKSPADVTGATAVELTSNGFEATV